VGLSYAAEYELSRRSQSCALGRGEEKPKVEALDSGADDYVTKPFNMNELVARVRQFAEGKPSGS